MLGVPVDTSQPGETSTRIVGNYLRGRLPAVLDAPINFVDVEDVADGHLLAADKGNPGERYILGGHNRPWAELIDMVAHASGIHHPLLVVPAEVGAIARLRERLGLPGAISAEAFGLMGQDWRFTSAKAKRELGYRPRPLAADRLRHRRVVPRADRGAASSTTPTARRSRSPPRASRRRAPRALVAAAPG